MKAFKFTLFFIIVSLLVVFATYWSSCENTKHIRLAIGAKNGAYYRYALKYKRELLKEANVTIEIVPTKGSISAQRLLLNHKVDFAFVQGGTEEKKILGLANVEYEPVWIFYYDNNITDLKSLKGRNIAVSQKGSGILPTARELLNLVGINPWNSNFHYIPNEDAFQALQKGTVDAMFYIAAPNASLLKRLMKLPNIKLMNFEEAASYRQYFIKRKKYFSIVQLHQYGFDLRKLIPSEAHTLLATTAILATNDESSDDMVRLMLKVSRRIHHKMGIFHDEETFPNPSLFNIQRHPAAKHYFRKSSNYYEEHFDYWTARTLTHVQDIFLKFLLPLVTLFAFFIEVIHPAYNIYTRRPLDKWYYEINALDTEMETLNLSDAKKKRIHLHNLLLEIRNCDDIPATHMELFYTLQNQVVNITDDLDKYIADLSRR